MVEERQVCGGPNPFRCGPCALGSVERSRVFAAAAEYRYWLLQGFMGVVLSWRNMRKRSPQNGSRTPAA